MDRFAFNPFSAAIAEAAAAAAAAAVSREAAAAPHPMQTTVPIAQVVSVGGVGMMQKVALYDWSFYDADFYGA